VRAADEIIEDDDLAYILLSQRVDGCRSDKAGLSPYDDKFFSSDIHALFAN